MLEIKFDNPTKEELNEALKKLRMIEPKENKDARKKEALDFMNVLKRLSKEAIIYKTYKEQKKKEPSALSLRVDVHNQRLNRQGKDIFTLWNRVEKLEKADQKMIKVVRELLRNFDFEINVEKNGEVRLEENRIRDINEIK